jgi:hypothetical protein
MDSLNHDIICININGPNGNPTVKRTIETDEGSGDKQSAKIFD